MNRKHSDHFHIAGFTFYEGVLAFSQLQAGTELLLKPEPDNRHDENAVAIWHNDHMKSNKPNKQKNPGEG